MQARFFQLKGALWVEVIMDGGNNSLQRPAEDADQFRFPAAFMAYLDAKAQPQPTEETATNG